MGGVGYRRKHPGRAGMRCRWSPTSILRRLERAQIVSRIEANGAQADLLEMDIELFPFAPFARRVREFRSNLTSYDARYVAPAEAMDCPLLTLDRKLSRTPGPKCAFIVPAQPRPAGLFDGLSARAAP